MITKVKQNLITGSYYVYRSASPKNRVSVELRKKRTKEMDAFMTKAKVNIEGNYLTYT